jgi:phosphinothricin acetyltransferase
MIKNASFIHAREISEIYNYYIKNSTITFEEKEVSELEMKTRIQKLTKKFPWIVYLEQGKVLGYAYVSEWKSRGAYKYSVESTIYLHPDAKGKKIGSKLYADLLERSKNNELHAIIAGIALPNDASIALHKKFGFEKVAQFKEVGNKFDQWVDVSYWELLC